MVQDLLTLPENLSSPTFCSDICVAQCLVFCVVFYRPLFSFLYLFFEPLHNLSFELWFIITTLSVSSNFSLNLILFFGSSLLIINITQHSSTNVPGAAMVVIVWYLDLQLRVQSVPITTKVVSSNPVHSEVYSIQHYVIKFVSDLPKTGDFLRVLQFPPPIKLTATK